MMTNRLMEMMDLFDEYKVAKEMVRAALKPQQELYEEAEKAEKQASKDHEICDAAVVDAFYKLTDYDKNLLVSFLQPQVDAVKSAGFSDTWIGVNISCSGVCIEVCNNRGGFIVLDPEKVPYSIKPWASALKAKMEVLKKYRALRDNTSKLCNDYNNMRNKLMDEATKAAVEFRTREFRDLVGKRIQSFLNDTGKPKVEDTSQSA